MRLRPSLVLNPGTFIHDRRVGIVVQSGRNDQRLAVGLSGWLTIIFDARQEQPSCLVFRGDALVEKFPQSWRPELDSSFRFRGDYVVNVPSIQNAGDFERVAGAPDAGEHVKLMPAIRVDFRSEEHTSD